MHEPIARSVRNARRPNAVAVAANRIAVAGMKPPPSAISAISTARPPRIRTIGVESRLSRAAFAGRQRQTAIADRRSMAEHGAMATTGITCGPTP